MIEIRYKFIHGMYFSRGLRGVITKVDIYVMRFIANLVVTEQGQTRESPLEICFKVSGLRGKSGADESWEVFVISSYYNLR